MTKTSPARISAIALLLPLFLGMIAFASMHSAAGGSTTSALAAQNTNKSAATKSTKKPATKVDCSTADDAALAAQIKERHSKRAALKGEKDIKIDVKAGVATLSGSVASKSHRVFAVAEAKKVKCVKSVGNSLNIKCSGCTEYCCDGVCQDHECAPKKPKK